MFLDTSIYCVPDACQPLVFTLCQKLNHVTPNPQSRPKILWKSQIGYTREAWESKQRYWNTSLRLEPENNKIIKSVTNNAKIRVIKTSYRDEFKTVDPRIVYTHTRTHTHMHTRTQFGAHNRGFAQNKGDQPQARKLREGDAHPITALRKKGVIKPHR